MNYEELIRLVHSVRPLFVDDTQKIEVKVKGRADFVTQIDVAVQEILRKGLHELAPEVLLLSEEQERLRMEPGKAYWILDPIDGTQNFIRHVGMSAVSLAYYAGEVLQFGVIYNPFTEETFHAIRGKGAFLNNRPIHVTDSPALENSLIAIGTSPYNREMIPKNWPLFQAVHSRCLDIRRSGSAALDLAYVAAGRFDGYFERNLKPWDMAAGILLVQEAGGLVTDYEGCELDVNYNADVCGANGKINAELLALFAEYK